VASLDWELSKLAQLERFDLHDARLTRRAARLRVADPRRVRTQRSLPMQTLSGESTYSPKAGMRANPARV
jgi:hypothetical protein